MTKSLYGRKFFYLVAKHQGSAPCSSLQDLIEENFPIERVLSPDEADILIYIDGPRFDYSTVGLQEDKHATSVSYNNRDGFDIAMFRTYKKSGKLHVGVSRGALVLHSLNGGNIYYGVTGHTNTRHACCDTSGTVFESTFSSHVDMMQPPHKRLKKRGSKVLAYACDYDKRTRPYKPINLGISESRRMSGLTDKRVDVPVKRRADPEVIWHPRTQSLCFQPCLHDLDDSIRMLRSNLYSVLGDYS